MNHNGVPCDYCTDYWQADSKTGCWCWCDRWREWRKKLEVKCDQ